MRSRDEQEMATAGVAALSICESLLIALNDLLIIDNQQTRGVLEDAATSHRNADPGSLNPEEHKAVAVLIERIMNGQNSVRRFPPSA